MKEKKPVYNGYEERYLTGYELKETFKNHYYSTGRHHSVVLGITIPDFLELIGISDSKEYRIFINNSFCRVMKADDDAVVVFFGHSTLENVQTKIDVSNIHLEKVCPECGSAMNFKSGKFGEFLGCSGYPNCKKSIKIPILGNKTSLHEKFLLR